MGAWLMDVLVSDPAFEGTLTGDAVLARAASDQRAIGAERAGDDQIAEHRAGALPWPSGRLTVTTVLALCVPVTRQVPVPGAESVR